MAGDVIAIVVGITACIVMIAMVAGGLCYWWAG
jgi:hypothetical protein